MSTMWVTGAVRRAVARALIGVAAGLGGFGGARAALAQVEEAPPRAELASGEALTLDIGRAYLAAATQPAGEPGQPGGGAASGVPAAPARPVFGHAGTTWLSATAAVGEDSDGDSDVNLALGWSLFLADELEFGVEAAGWYFNQHGDNTGAVSGSFRLRWHFWHDAAYDWTVYGDVGIGLLGAFDEVPDGATGFAFVPRAGAGYTRRLTDDGLRLDVGVRWQHLSNGRIEGDVRNPGRDSLAIYAGIAIPF